MPSARQLPGRHAIAKPIAAVVIPFDETEFLPADVEIRYRDGEKQGVSAISQLPHPIYAEVTIFRARFGEKSEEFIVDITVANAVLDRISRRRKGGDRV
ncbi:MAG TPA: hypothetical protein VLC46_20385 [Thermoanaerobaculia bacterium]|nr:hypothetical protein [Thermoanaerobaculia bacterium]